MTRRRETALTLSVVALFFLVRLWLLVVREPFFDELFTVWMARRPFGEILPALLLDSGPPLYYFIARIPDVLALRVVSLLFATATLALILTRRSIGNGRWVAAVLFALHPPAALFAVDARAYALCGLFVALGAMAVHEQRPWGSALAFLAAAYTHWYGALFLPLVLLVKPRRVSATAFAVACALFLPGLWLASRQPAEAMGWLTEQNPLAALQTFAFVGGKYAEALFAPAPLALVVISAIVLLIAGMRSWSFAPVVLVPVLLAMAFAVGGRTVYFPMRFESVLAAPLALWLGRSMQWWRRDVRWVLTTLLGAIGAIVIVRGAIDHQQRPLDPYRQAAVVLAQNVRQGDRILATGYLYLEATHQLGTDVVKAWPSEQGRHPGWRAPLAREPFPQGPLVWIVERNAPELALFGAKRFRVLFLNERAMVVRVD